jgi:Zn-finger nucleic acid-binding protein
MKCPRCDGRLEARTLEGVEVEVCDTCTGTLVPIPRLVPLLDKLSGPMMHVIDMDEPIEPAPDAGETVRCPRCRKAMEPFGYLGTRTVTVDRCSDDMVIWVDPDELGVMSILYARTNKRTGERTRKEHEWRQRFSESTSRILSARARSHRVARAFLAGNSYGSLWNLLDDVS